jgi:hypothetical protein
LIKDELIRLALNIRVMGIDVLVGANFGFDLFNVHYAKLATSTGRSTAKFLLCSLMRSIS